MHGSRKAMSAWLKRVVILVNSLRRYLSLSGQTGLVVVTAAFHLDVVACTYSNSGRRRSALIGPCTTFLVFVKQIPERCLLFAGLRPSSQRRNQQAHKCWNGWGHCPVASSSCVSSHILSSMFLSHLNEGLM